MKVEVELTVSGPPSAQNTFWAGTFARKEKLVHLSQEKTSP